MVTLVAAHNRTDALSLSMDKYNNPTIFVIILLVLLYYEVEGLTCYKCPTSSSRDSTSANINCLANVTEIQCKSEQDRCYTLTSGAAIVKVEKGCTISESCLGNTICCTRDFCNAGQSSKLQTGFDKPCGDISDCVQGVDDMMCSARSTEDNTRVCLCTSSRYHIGAACRSMSRVGEPCMQDGHCLAYNSFCENKLCRCGVYFYPNDTFCMLKAELTAPCAHDIHCRAWNSMCAGGTCMCKPGYDTLKEQGTCGAGMSDLSVLLLVLVSTLTIYHSR